MYQQLPRFYRIKYVDLLLDLKSYDVQLFNELQCLDLQLDL